MPLPSTRRSIVGLCCALAATPLASCADDRTSPLSAPAGASDAGLDAPVAIDASTPEDAHADGGAADGASAIDNEKPVGLGDVTVADYDGVANDLLTGGLGKSGLTGAPPTVSSPPTAAELRTLAIYSNYRALVDFTAGGGFGTLFGPNVDNTGHAVLGEGKIAGKEYIAFYDDGTGARNVTLMVQVPRSFDKARPCIVTGTSSGSRGIYGAIATSGDWGLKQGCAVAYSDKGTGIGIHDLMSDTVGRIDGTRDTRKAAGLQSTFRAPLDDAQLAAFNGASPYRLAVKHVHSRQSPERSWGEDTLLAVRFAFYALNEQLASVDSLTGKHRREILPESTIVIASSASNGAGAAIAAAEEDDAALIDGVVASEPQVQSGAPVGLSIVVGDAPVASIGRNIADYASFAALYAPCAILSPNAAPDPSLVPTAATPGQTYAYASNRCAELRMRNLLTADLPSAQAEEALQKLVGYGWTPESLPLVSSHVTFHDLYGPVAIAYVTAYGKFGVEDSLCGFSVAAADNSPSGAGKIIPIPQAALATAFATGNGLPDSTSVPSFVYTPNGHPDTDTRSLDFASSASLVGSLSPTAAQVDRAFDGILCIRSLVLGVDAISGAPLSPAMAAASARVRAGIAEVQRTGALHGKPAIVMQGRSDALLPLNDNGRAYVAKNHAVDGAAASTVYYEITHAQHLDVYAAVPSLKLDASVVPLGAYFGQAMGAMFAHLQSGAPLPPSQVVRTTPRGGTPGASPAISAANVPPIAANPAAGDQITFVEGTLHIPN